MTETTETEIKPLSEQDIKDATKRIATALDESAPKPRRQISHIIERAGIEFVDNLLKETEAIQEDGGMMVESGDRKRTKGGVFFYLARKHLPDEIRDDIFHNWRAMRRRQAEHEAQFEKFEWENRLSIFEALLENDRGEASEVKITLTGRPGEIERRQNLVVTTMDYEVSDKLTLPTGVPDFPESKITYVIFISSKQWEGVEKALKKPHDQMVVEGMCAYDTEANQYSIYATYVTTKRLQRKERKQAKKEQEAAKRPASREGSGRDKGASNRDHDKKRSRHLDFPPENSTPAVKVDLPEGITDDVAEELTRLHTAAATYRQKIATLEEKPDGQKFMLNMTRKLLTDTEKQIEKLENQKS